MSTTPVHEQARVWSRLWLRGQESSSRNASAGIQGRRLACERSLTESYEATIIRYNAHTLCECHYLTMCLLSFMDPSPANCDAESRSNIKAFTSRIPNPCSTQFPPLGSLVQSISQYVTRHGAVPDDRAKKRGMSHSSSTIAVYAQADDHVRASSPSAGVGEWRLKCEHQPGLKRSRVPLHC